MQRTPAESLIQPFRRTVHRDTLQLPTCAYYGLTLLVLSRMIIQWYRRTLGGIWAREPVFFDGGLDLRSYQD